MNTFPAIAQQIIAEDDFYVLREKHYVQWMLFIVF